MNNKNMSSVTIARKVMLVKAVMMSLHSLYDPSIPSGPAARQALEILKSIVFQHRGSCGSEKEILTEKEEQD